MGRMTETTFSVLFEYGKKVYKGELSPDEAAKKANSSNPEVAISSAKHYITWYSRMKNGEFLTWNTNAKLLLYYAKRIIKEDGLEAGKTAIESAKKYAENAGRSDLGNDLDSLANENGIQLSSSDSHTPKDNRSDFEVWLKNHEEKNYTDHTIYTYIHALDMIETWLSIKLIQPVLCTNSNQEFQAVYEQITSVPNYKELNKQHGHGEMSAALTMYQAYIAEKDLGNTWLPSIEEYDPHITKNQWLELLSDGKIFLPQNLLAMACIYDNYGEGSCMGLAAKYNQSMTLWRTSCGVHLAGRIADKLQCPLMQSDGKTTYFVIPFLYRKAGSEEEGSWIYKLRPELYEALAEFGIERYLPENDKPKEGEEKVPLTTREAIDQIKQYIAARGFSYADGMIENFFLSLKSKPFVILAGTSGTGKTRLVKLFAEAIGAAYELVSVRPDWSDGSDLFGHYDLNGNFIKGPVCNAFEKARANSDKPVILCLDEMNLARVEYYLSDFLSVIESREKLLDGAIQTSPIAQYPEGIPSNLYVVGTVNMDETTFPFSKKVLDRANTIEFSYVDLLPDFGSVDNSCVPLEVSNDFLKTQYLVLARDCVEQKEFVEDICLELQELNEILLKANAHVGYRVRDEIVFYMLNNHVEGDLISFDQALDNEIMQKILPRIQGSAVAIKNMMIDLFKYCMGDLSGIDTDSGNAGKQMLAVAASAKYPESAKKLGYMMTRYEEDGFTSYWL